MLNDSLRKIQIEMIRFFLMHSQSNCFLHVYSVSIYLRSTARKLFERNKT